MPTVLTNVPAIFMHTMKKLFFDMLYFGMAVVLNDIVVYSCIVKEHFLLLKKVLESYISIYSTVSLRSAVSYTMVQCSLNLM